MSTAVALIDQAKSLILAQADEFRRVSVDSSVNFEREAGFAVQILQNNDYLLKIAMTNQPSLRAAVTNISAIGISLNPAARQAYLVPRKNSLCLDISYMGLMDLAMITGVVRWAKAELVRANDVFELNRLDELPTHVFKPFDTGRGDIVGVYSVIKTADGDYLTHCMPIADVFAIRARSDSWKAYVADNKKLCSWVTDEGEMIKKVNIKQAYKYWPKNARLDEAIRHMNEEGGEGIEFSKPAHGPVDIARKTATQPQDDDATLRLIADLELIAEEGGIDAFGAAWERLHPEQRKSVGKERKESIKAKCRPSGDVIEGVLV